MTTPNKKDLKREYKETVPVAGVFQIKNKVNGKVFLGSSLNIAGPLSAHEFMLASGSHRNAELLADYKKFGAAAFSFDILDVVHVKDVPGFQLEIELKALEELWLDELNSVTPNGYNRNTKIRQA